MSLPFTTARRGPPPDPCSTPKGPPATSSTARLSTAHSSNRPISTSSRGYSITSKNSLPEKQLLSRYRHVYAGKGGWFQGRASFAPPANYSQGPSSRHLDGYRKELIMRLSKDIFENSKQKIASADYVVSNKVAGDPAGEVHNVTTKIGDSATKTMTSVETHSPLPMASPRMQRQESARNNVRISISQRQTRKPTFNGLNSSRYREQSATSKNPININVRGGTSNREVPSRLHATTAVGYRSSAAKLLPQSTASDDLTSSRTEANHNARHNQDVLSQEQTTQADPDPGLETVVKQKRLDNDLASNHLCTALNRSHTIHEPASFKKGNIADNAGEVKAEEHKDSDNRIANEAKGINDNLKDTQEDCKTTGDSQSKCLTHEPPEQGLVNSHTPEQGLVNSHKQENSKPHSSVKRSLENNLQDKSDVHYSASKSAKRDKVSAKSKRTDYVGIESIAGILGEIQFNVLRQRSFIRLPKKLAKMLENERPVTRGENGVEGRQLLSRMSLSKEAQDALQETRKEMKLETVVDLDKYDLRKLISRGNKRPNTPTPESSKEDASSVASTESSLTPHALPPTSRVKKTHKNQSFDELDGIKIRNGMTRMDSKKKLNLPSVKYNTDSSRDKFNQSLENGVQRRTAGSRASTVATPITDLIPAIPKEQQDGYQRYSTNMSRDTARTNQRNASTKTRRLTAGAVATKTQILAVPNEPKNGIIHTKNANNSYTVPLKLSSEDIPDAKNATNGFNNEVESIKSDWESQLRAMSKYGLVTEKSFQITPPGWDERYKDLKEKNSGKLDKEADSSLAEVKEKAIEKCSDWLHKYAAATSK